MPADQPEAALFHLDELAEGQSLGIDRGELALLAVKKRGQIYIYRNRCPHIGIRLEWIENQFLDPGGDLIQCANHAALFKIDDGHCVAGPCVGASLEALAFEIRGDQVFLAQPL